MPSIGSQLAQRLTKSFTVVKAGTAAFTFADVETLLGSPTQLGNNYIYTVDNFINANLPGNSGSSLDANKTLKDLGKEIRYGTQDEQGLLVLRLVQRAGSVSNNGVDTNPAFYVVVENNVSGLAARYDVGVARV